jgi:two-component system cell cycle sensor histidine kinase/response regulator CckA
MEELAGHGHVVLVVDDDPAIRELVGDVLRAEGFGVHGAPGVEEAILLLGQYHHEICVILIDVMMPQVSGADGIPRLGQISNAPIVAMSASADHLVSASAAGAAAVLRKPFSLDTLHALLLRHCLRGR